MKNLLEGKETVIKNIKKADKKMYDAVVKLKEKRHIDLLHLLGRLMLTLDLRN